ncbi:hypothetical protein ASZ90_017651 [hydrocarbon metagenome]|uniref:Uncharacterized protein n=1 Tax=hydrocarbon metagenome TaxID=938273 RepID=A0A0W8E952_9ZZZZ
MLFWEGTNLARYTATDSINYSLRQYFRPFKKKKPGVAFWGDPDLLL